MSCAQGHHILLHIESYWILAERKHWPKPAMPRMSTALGLTAGNICRPTEALSMFPSMFYGE